MTNGSDEMAWSPMQFATQLQEAGQEMTAQQMQAFTELLSSSTDSGPSGFDPAGMASLGTGMAMFKTRVQSGGRISIPDTEREVLGIDEGDIVQTFVIPITQPSSDTNE
ncbi:hypothetical protein halTADL_0774 [Halohasta litchfieldiae]|jgi:hypothetical protein|uniref:SpoVT-AbrB domain-containing protein n=1 Tax=Halohasta litchfieldiae TaxID=1073996 RepID=A0A1H6UXL3_9EURY|nr:AbrB/MazE/SpoVT family DNA-binding domain-containing protein [Halohasta litchfieldiae]ATW87572.1 hypothetical protein halTADL_0774 [Halohasta litchfieldiae]SEI97133.1 hypothetical protein SAMN05444271_11430 [Halohasta litchfieldiae]